MKKLEAKIYEETIVFGNQQYRKRADGAWRL